MPLQIAPMACSRTPKWSVRPYGCPGNAAVACAAGTNESAPFMVVLLLSARSADPPHSSGRVSASADSTCPEARRVAMPTSSGSNTGSASVQPSGSWRVRSRSCNAERCGLSCAQEW